MSAYEKAQALKRGIAGGVRVVVAAQLFPTPAALAARLCELAGTRWARRVLEPSAGTGRIMSAIYATGTQSVTAVEINDNLATALRMAWPQAECLTADFLTLNGLGLFDAIVMNPPFENGADIKHIQHAYTFLQVGGTLAAICANGPRQRRILGPSADYWEDLPPGSFAESGTNVNAAICVIKRG